MTFNLVQLGWPNTAAIVALVVMPFVALTIPTGETVEAAHALQTACFEVGDADIQNASALVFRTTIE